MRKALSLTLAVVMLLATLAMAGCGKTPETNATETVAPTATTVAAKDVKVGFIYIGPITDKGWTEAQNNGRLAMNEACGVESLYVENVPETAACKTDMENLIDQGCNVICATSYGFMDYVIEVAKEYPDVIFLHCSGYKTAENVGVYFGKIEQPRYLSGIAAAMKTQTKKIGYVAAMQIPECIRGINAFTLGVQSVDPTITVEVIWTNTWFDMTVEKNAALTLLNKGCDVIAQHQDSSACQIAAEEKGAFAVGYDMAVPDAAPAAYLTAPVFNWSAYYIAEINSIKAGTWKTDNYWGGMKEGVVDLASLSALCADGTQAKVDAAKAKILDGTLENVFVGPIYDQAGTLKVAEGEKLADADQLSMDWFVKGVIGSTK